MVFRVSGFAFRVQGLGFRLWCIATLNSGKGSPVEVIGSHLRNDWLSGMIFYVGHEYCPIFRV